MKFIPLTKKDEKSYRSCQRSNAGKRKNEFTDGQW